MEYDRERLIALRLRSQWLDGHSDAQPESVVRRLVAVQAQDARWAHWSVGLRTPGCTGADVDAALGDRRIVRTWLLRGTLHLVAATDLHWLTALLAPRIIQVNARRYRQLTLDEAQFGRSQEILRQAIEQDGPLTRAEIKARFDASGIPAEGQQLPYLLQRAALDGVICFGLDRGHEPTYVLVSQWIDAPTSAAGAETGMAQLAARYFVSHSPTTVDDFAWWSGFTKTQSRAAAESAADLAPVTKIGDAYWMDPDNAPVTPPADAHLLPPFDGYLLGYRDRSPVLDPRYADEVNRGGGMLRPTILVAGRVVGTWRREMAPNEIVVSAALFEGTAPDERSPLEGATARYGRFHGIPARLKIVAGPGD